MARSGTNPTTITSSGGGGGATSVVGTHTFTDAYANPADDLDVVALNGGFNGATWDRLRSGTDSTDNQATTALGVLLTIGRNYIWDSVGSNWDRWTGSVAISNSTLTIVGNQTPGDAVANPTDALDTRDFLEGWNGATWDRIRTVNGDLTSSQGIMAVGQYLMDGGTFFNRAREVPTSDGVTTSGITAAGMMLSPAGGATMNRVREVGVDAMAQTGLLPAANQAWNGASWDRLRSVGNNTDTLATTTLGVLQVNATLRGLNNAGTYDRLHSIDNNNDGVSSQAQGVLLTSNYNMIFNGATWDRLRASTAGTGSALVGGNKTPADAYANPNDGLDTIALNAGFNGTTWDRLRSAGDNADAVAVATLGNLLTNARNDVFNGTTWDRMRSGTATGSVLVNNPTAANLLATVTQGTSPWVVSGTTTAVGNQTPGDAVANPTDAQDTRDFLEGFNGTTWDRLRSAGDNADAVATITLGELQVLSRETLFNGTTWDRWRTAPGVTGTASVGGPTASGTAVAVAPVTVGARASNAVPTAVGADGQVVNLWANRNGRLRVHQDRPNISGIYYASGALSTVTAAADAATAGRFWLINPVGSGLLVALRQLSFNNGAGLIIVTTTTPQFSVERVTFTGTASGAQVTAGKRDSTDPAATATLRTASTGLVLTAGAQMTAFSIPEVVTAVGTNTNTVERIVFPEDERIVLRAGEGLVVRQATAGTALDTRWVQIDWVWEEFTALGNL